jgi:hypothetical protein
MKKYMSVLLAGLWINFSEFFRNEILLKEIWLSFYQRKGLEFPSSPINGVVWVVWGFVFAACITTLSKRLSSYMAFVLSWVMGFGLMWMVAWNLGVLPIEILIYAVPLSGVEVGVAVFLGRRLG